MKKNSRPSREHYCDWSALDISTLIGQKLDEIRGYPPDIRQISTGGIYNFPAQSFIANLESLACNTCLRFTYRSGGETHLALNLLPEAYWRDGVSNLYQGRWPEAYWEGDVIDLFQGSSFPEDVKSLRTFRALSRKYILPEFYLWSRR